MLLGRASIRQPTHGKFEAGRLEVERLEAERLKAGKLIVAALWSTAHGQGCWARLLANQSPYDSGSTSSQRADTRRPWHRL